MISVKNSKAHPTGTWPGSHIAGGLHRHAFVAEKNVYDEYYAAAKGIRRVVPPVGKRPRDVKENPKSGGVVVVLEDAASDEMIEQEFDLVVLSASMQAPTDLDELNSQPAPRAQP